MIKMSLPIKTFSRPMPGTRSVLYAYAGIGCLAYSGFEKIIADIALCAQVEYIDAKEYVLKKALQSPFSVMEVAQETLDYARINGRLE